MSEQHLADSPADAARRLLKTGPAASLAGLPPATTRHQSLDSDERGEVAL